MKRVLQFLSFLALAAVVIPAVLFFYGRLDLPMTQRLLLGSAVLWLVVTPFWMERRPPA
jgi:branched-subunit amino acid transport protein